MRRPDRFQTMLFRIKTAGTALKLAGGGTCNAVSRSNLYNHPEKPPSVAVTDCKWLRRRLLNLYILVHLYCAAQHHNHPPVAVTGSGTLPTRYGTQAHLRISGLRLSAAQDGIGTALARDGLLCAVMGRKVADQTMLEFISRFKGSHTCALQADERQSQAKSVGACTSVVTDGALVLFCGLQIDQREKLYKYVF